MKRITIRPSCCSRICVGRLRVRIEFGLDIMTLTDTQGQIVFRVSREELLRKDEDLARSARHAVIPPPGGRTVVSQPETPEIADRPR